MLVSTFEKGIWDLKVPLKDSLQVSRGKKSIFARNWKNNTIPTVSDWELKLGEFSTMAKLTVYMYTRDV